MNYEFGAVLANSSSRRLTLMARRGSSLTGRWAICLLHHFVDVAAMFYCFHVEAAPTMRLCSIPVTITPCMPNGEPSA